MLERGHVLLITRNLPPLRGGMERLNLHIVQELVRVAEVAVCGPVGCQSQLPERVDVEEVPHRPLPTFFLRALLASLRLARRRPPIVVLAGSGLTAPLAWLVARMSGARFAVYVHGLDLVAPSLLYQWLWLPCIRRADQIIANSRNTKRLAEARGARAGAIAIVHPGTDLSDGDGGAGDRFRARHGLTETLILLSVGRLTRRKGLAEFVRQSMPAVLARHPMAKLVVIGEDAVDAVSAARGSERANILSAATEAGVAHALMLLPPCDDSALSEAWQAADVHVFPVCEVPGDVEGFGMVAIEAAAHGLPTVAFDVGGVADAVVEGESGKLIRAGDYQGMAVAIDGLLPPTSLQRDACRQASTAFGWDVFGRRLRGVLLEREGL